MPWEKQEDYVIERELTYTMQRHQIDEELFMIYFMVPVKKDLLELLK